MGYTHYWRTREITPASWEAILADVRKILAADAVPLAFEYDKTDKPPKIDGEAIRFNGRDEDGHETFLFQRAGRDFSFCKTARKPYDVVVVACLLAVNRHAADKAEISSDGAPEEWADGVALFEKATGEKAYLPKRVAIRE